MHDEVNHTDSEWAPLATAEQKKKREKNMMLGDAYSLLFLLAIYCISDIFDVFSDVSLTAKLTNLLSQLAATDIYGLNAAGVLIYSVFLSLPIFMIVLAFYIYRPFVRIMQVGQDPLPGEVVYKPTRYKRGAMARIKPVLLLMVLCLLHLYMLYSAHGVGLMFAAKLTQIESSKEISSEHHSVDDVVMKT